MNFAIIGTNFVTDWFLDAGKYCSSFTLSAVYSRTQERANEYADKHNAKYTFTNINDLCLCDKVDAVYIASPTSCHYKQAIQLMESGKHILCEKPIASNCFELTSMINCSKKNKVVLLEAIRPEYSPVLDIIRKNIKTIGEIRRVSISFCKYSSRYDRFLSGELVNAFNPSFSNGALNDLGCYCILIVLKLFGYPNRIQSSAIKLKNGVDAVGTILADYEDFIAELSYSKVSDSHNYCEIQGEKGTLQFQDPATLKGVKLHKRGQKSELISAPIFEHDMIYELQAFIDYVNNPIGFDTRLKYSLDTMKIMDKVRKQCEIVFPADSLIDDS